jgi:hypothetical protein
MIPGLLKIRQKVGLLAREYASKISRGQASPHTRKRTRGMMSTMYQCKFGSVRDKSDCSDHGWTWTWAGRHRWHSAANCWTGLAETDNFSEACWSCAATLPVYMPLICSICRLAN